MGNLLAILVHGHTNPKLSKLLIASAISGSTTRILLCVSPTTQEATTGRDRASPNEAALAHYQAGQTPREFQSDLAIRIELTELARPR
ncbi:MAG: hypothetical protein O7I42_19915, partial [Alphaproteobacteria bacterium]|nr:hypothetical protein [Alphaproteobacteria bacterium]